MIQPGKLDLTGYDTVAFGYQIDVRGLDLAAANVKAQVRAQPGKPDPALASFTVSTPALSNDSGVPVSTFAITLDAGTMASLRQASAIAQAWIGAWDLVVAPANDPNGAYILLAGSFTVNPGVTHV